MALAEALHHSSGLKVMERAQRAALRGQKSSTRAGVAGPAPVTEYVAPAHAVAPFSSPAVTFEVPAPVIEYVAHAPAVTYAAPAPVIDYIALAPAVTYAAPAPVIDYVAPAPSVNFAAPASVFEYVAPAPVLEYIEPALAVSFVAPSQQLRPAYTADSVTTGVNLDADFVGSASQVVGSLPHGEVFAAPVFNQVHQEQLAGGEIPENLVEIPVVQKQVIVQASPHVVGSLPPVAEFTSPMYNPVHQEQFSAGDTAENFAIQVLVGMRPVPPSEVAGPQVAAATGGYVAAGAPLLVVASLAGRDDVDGTTVSFLLAENLKLQKKVEEEEKERRRKRLEAGDREEISLAVHEEAAAALERARLLLVQAGKRRKRKKRRKRRTPRTSSIPGRTRRRQRQWLACSAGFTGDDVPHGQSGLAKSGFAGDPAPRAVFLPLFSSP